jgi:hypothetical protein
MMKPLLLWALWAMPYHGATTIPAYFETQAECERVVTILRKTRDHDTVYQCVQAHYVPFDSGK